MTVMDQVWCCAYILLCMGGFGGLLAGLILIIDPVDDDERTGGIIALSVGGVCVFLLCVGWAIAFMPETKK